jgi:hypothetical protein
MRCAALQALRQDGDEHSMWLQHVATTVCNQPAATAAEQPRLHTLPALH